MKQSWQFKFLISDINKNELDENFVSWFVPLGLGLFFHEI